MLYLRKNLSLNDVRLKMDGEAGRFTGYASVFGAEHHSGDIVVKGAFADTLRTHGMPKMYLEHAWTNPFSGGSASLPIGLFPVCKEDDTGLLVEGELTPGMSLSQEVRAAMKHGTLDGLSVGGYIKKGDYEETAKGLVIKRWTHLKEISVVVDPDDPGARVERASVKAHAELLAQIEQVETIREIESLLRDVAGIGKGAAAALVARVKSIAGQGEPGPAEDKAMQHFLGRMARLSAEA